MSTPDDPGLWSKLATGAAGIVTALVSLVWFDYRARVLKVEEGLAKKADMAEVERQRDNVAELFRGQDEVKDFVHVEVKELGSQITAVEKVAIRLEEQVGRFVSDIESEKRTRAEANRLINVKLDELMRSIERRSKPR